jgi:hypothetical protein
MSTTKLDDYYYVLTRLGFSIDSCLLTFRNAPLSINDVEYVAIRVLEPSDFHVASDVNIVLLGHVRHIVVCESDALCLEFFHDTLYVLADHPSQGCGFIGSGVLRLVNVNRGISTPEDDDLLTFSADLRQTKRLFIEFLGCFQILDRDVRDRIFIA